MFIAVFLAANTVGAIPLITVFIIKYVKDPSVLSQGTDNIADLSAFGIEPNVAFLLMVVPFIASLAALVIFMKPLHARPFMTVINGGGKIRWERFFFSAFIWIILMGIYLVLNIRFDAENFNIHNLSLSLVPLILISLVFIPFQASFEEVLFRGYLMPGIGAWTRNKWLPLLVTSVLFALVFGLVAILDDGIEVAMGAHTANNVFLSIFVTNKASALQTAAVFEQQIIHPWAEFISLLIVAIIFIIILGIRYKWQFRKTQPQKITY